jgi:hypothetical protein
VAPARGAPATLPLGDPDLAETRSTETLAPGVTLTRIVRGTDPAAADEIDSTTRGPWQVAIVRVDPATARGHLRATYGPDLSRTEPTSELVAGAGALVGVNASFFHLGDPTSADPVGLGLYGGRLLSEPDPASTTEADVLVDAATNRLSYGRLSWSGRLRNTTTGRVLALQRLNRQPTVPSGCAQLVHQERCRQDGDVSLLTRELGAATPAGYGVEVVLGPRGCVRRTLLRRGTTLLTGQRSVQATGSDAAALLRVRRGGCLAQRSVLSREDGSLVRVGRSTFGVDGRYRLARAGRILVPSGPGTFYTRNPRTVVGTTRTGVVLIVTIDGRRTTSVGTSMQETADVVASLGLRDAVNLDGGGSTAMAVKGRLVNQPSGPEERPVADALVYVPAPFR